MTIRHITYHILHKEQNGEAKLELNPSPLTPNEAHHNFLETLTKAYHIEYEQVKGLVHLIVMKTISQCLDS